MPNGKSTSHRVSSLAGQILNDKNASDVAKRLAGSALSQVNKGNETGTAMETLASTVLHSPKYGSVAKELAATVLSQSDGSK